MPGNRRDFDKLSGDKLRKDFNIHDAIQTVASHKKKGIGKEHTAIIA